MLENVYIIVPICIIAGALSMFSVQGCVPDIFPREILSLGQYFSIHSPGGREYMENMISIDHIIRYHPCCK